jgi:formaldehyde-activating enzyme involved in methanogenesis
MMIKVHVPPDALDRQTLFDNNYEAVNSAVKQAFAGLKGGD